MKRYWNFPAGHKETYRWTDVAPGDLVYSPGVLGWRFRDRGNRNDDNMVTFAQNPLLVLARYEGPPDDSKETGITTFMCLSPSQGVVFILQSPDER